MTQKPTKKLIAVDLFCGVGGLTYGLRKAGIKVVAGIDSDESCRYAYESNNKESEFINKDIQKITTQDIQYIQSLFQGADVKILVGCAPCQTFSTHSNKIKKKKDLKQDERWGLLEHFSNIVKEIEPDIVSMENVPLLRKQDIFEKFVSDLRVYGFQVNYKIVNASDYGVPQRRKRLVLFASKKIKINLVAPNLNKVKTVKKTIADLPEISAGEHNTKDPLHRSAGLIPINIKRIQASKPGGSWRDWDRKLVAKCHKKKSGSTFSSVYARMEWDKPSPTITTQFMQYGTGRFGHPVQNRALSLREGALLQTFPKRYKFIKNKEQFCTARVARHIGNAVPPKLAQAIGESMVQSV